MTLPFVSCVMPTTASRAWCSPLAVEAFLAQTWPADRRELVIAVDRDDDYAAVLRAVMLDPRSASAQVTVVAVEPGTIGEKYNAAIRAAAGPVVALWEDDDYHAPTRLAHQLESWERALAAPRSTKLPPLAFTASRRLHYWDLESDDVRTLDATPGFCHGTFVGMRDAWLEVPYPALDAGNDGVWMLEVAKRYAIHEAPIGERYLATRHGQNTWDARGVSWLRSQLTADAISPYAARYRAAFAARRAAA